MEGTKEDIITSLVLDPNNEECLPLIARVFPGKSKTDLLEGSQARAAVSKLEADIRSKSPHKREEGGAPSQDKSLHGIELRFAVDGSTSEVTVLEHSQPMSAQSKEEMEREKESTAVSSRPGSSEPEGEGKHCNITCIA